MDGPYGYSKIVFLQSKIGTVYACWLIFSNCMALKKAFFCILGKHRGINGFYSFGVFQAEEVITVYMV